MTENLLDLWTKIMKDLLNTIVWCEKTKIMRIRNEYVEKNRNIYQIYLE